MTSYSGKKVRDVSIVTRSPEEEKFYKWWTENHPAYYKMNQERSLVAWLARAALDKGSKK
ncbi:MAG: hypothetical protein NTW48_09910 [Chloroflexi bacterium]|nr:hypothetical protein [Chloroflexota bacterium]